MALLASNYRNSLIFSEVLAHQKKQALGSPYMTLTLAEMERLAFESQVSQCAMLTFHTSKAWGWNEYMSGAFRPPTKIQSSTLHMSTGNSPTGLCHSQIQRYLNRFAKPCTLTRTMAEVTACVGGKCFR